MQIKIYDDEEGVRSAEIAKLGGNTQFSAFYERLKDIKDYYRLHPSYDVTQPPDDDAVIEAQVLSSALTHSHKNARTDCLQSKQSGMLCKMLHALA